MSKHGLFYVWISMDKQHFIEGPFFFCTILQSYCHMPLVLDSIELGEELKQH